MGARPLLWLPVTLALVGGTVAAALLWPRPQPVPPAARELRPAPGARVRVVLHLGRPVGWIEESATPMAGGATEVRERTVIEVQRAGRRATLERDQTARIDENGRLLEASLGAGELRVRAAIEPGALRLEVGGSRHRLPFDRPVHIESTALRWLARSGLAPGRREPVALLDLEHGLARPATLHVLGERSWHGARAWEVEIATPTGVSWRATIDARGDILASRSRVPGVETRLWRAGDDERPRYAVDLGLWGRVLTSGEIRDPARVRRLRLRLRGVPSGLGLPQEVELAAAALPADESTPGGGADRSPAPFLESDAPEIAAQARALAPPGTRPLAAARAVVDWVRANVRPADALGPPSALGAFRSRRGNCNEMAALATALLRAAGAPARLAFGVAWYQGAFRYHAWTLVRAGSQWVAVDPTTGQIPADATHFALATGGLEAQAALLDAVGRLTIEIVHADEGGA